MRRSLPLVAGGLEMKGMEHDPAISENKWGCSGLSVPQSPSRNPAQKRDHSLGHGQCPQHCEGLKFTLLSPGTCGLLHPSLPCGFEFPAMFPLQEPAPRSCPTARTHKSHSGLLSPCHPMPARLPALLTPYNIPELVGKHGT